MKKRKGEEKGYFLLRNHNKQIPSAVNENNKSKPGESWGASSVVSRPFSISKRLDVKSIVSIPSETLIMNL